MPLLLEDSNGDGKNEFFEWNNAFKNHELT